MKKQFLLGLMAMLLPLTMWAADFTVTWKEKVTYAGDGTKDAVAIKVYADANKTTLLNEGPDYYLDKVIRDAGEYTVKVIPMPSNPTYKDYKEKEITFVVEKMEVRSTAVTLQSVNIPYTGEIPELQALLDEDLVIVDGNALAANTDAEKDNFLKGLKVIPFGGTMLSPNVGSYSVDIEDAGLPTSNYTYVRSVEGVHVALNIVPKQLTLVLEPKTYKGAKFNPAELDSDDYALYENYVAEGNSANKKYEGTDLDDIKFTYTPGSDDPAQIWNVGVYPLNVVFDNENYVVKTDNVVTFTVTPAPMVVTVTDPAKLNGYYGYNNPIDLTTAFKIDDTKGWVGADAAALEASKPFKLALKRTQNETTTYGEVEVEKVGDCPIILYTTMLGSTTETAHEITKGANGTYNKVVVGNYEIDYDPQVYHLLKKGLALSDDFTFEKDPDADLTYQGQDFDTEGINLLKVTYHPQSNPSLEMPLTEGVDYELVLKPEIEGATIRNAGDKFTVIVKALAGETCNFRDATPGQGLEVKGMLFRINKAELTITPKDDAVLKKAWDNNTNVDVTDQFKFEGLKGEDQGEDEYTPVAGMLIMKPYIETADPVKSWPIYIRQLLPVEKGIQPKEYREEDVTKGMRNYLVTYTTQQFEVLEANLILYGSDRPEEEATNSEKLALYNGVENVTVTIKNFKEMLTGNAYLAKNAWHSMALPFATTAKDISNAFGYAVVDIPDQNNTTPGEISFKLTVGNVPANNLFLVKLADRFEEENIKFEGVTISYTPNEAGEIEVEDKGRNVYCAVYEETPLDKDETLFVVVRPGSTGGGFYEAKTNNITVYPLNGYIKSGVASAAETRFIIEEADGSTTAINTITGETSNSADSWYSIGGMKMNAQPTQKGIYINNGKKVVIK